MCAGEFGRTPKINKNTGRDHWARSMACVLAGGGFKRGYAHGTHRRQRHGPGDRPGHARTTSPARSSTTSASTRTRSCRPRPAGPIQLFREGKVIEKLIG